MIQLIKNLFFRTGRRADERAHIYGLTCNIMVVGGPSYESVPVFDLSISGVSFTMKNPNLEIGTKVSLGIVSKFGSSVSKTGQIASQRVYYPEGNDDLKAALYRFSAKFDSPISADIFEKLTEPPEQVRMNTRRK